jgi:hypothetical protein
MAAAGGGATGPTRTPSPHLSTRTWLVRRRWRDLEWIDKFSYVVMAGFVVVLVGLLVALRLNGH